MSSFDEKMKKSEPENVIQFKDAAGVKKRPRQIPAKIFGVSEAALFDKRPDKRWIGFLADGIKASSYEKASAEVFYDECAKRDEFGTLHKILRQGDAHESTRGKLLIAYKAALADSDAYIGRLADACDFSKPPKCDDANRNCIGWMFWGFMGPYDLGPLIRELGCTPPTLACVRRWFIKQYPGCKDNWPEGDESRDKVHRTTILRMGLPLGKDKIGRPPKVKTKSASIVSVKWESIGQGGFRANTDNA